jgi:predicted transcriptional regulator
MPTTVRARHKKRYTWSAVSTFAQAPAKANATTRAVIAELQRAGARTLKAIAQELEARGVRTPAGRDRWDAKQVSRLLAA